MSMHARPNGLPLSTTQVTPSPHGSPPKVSFSSSSGIRAPPTLDSDSDIDFFLSTFAQKNSISCYSSGIEFESEGFVSGDDEFAFETASERPSVTDPDDEILENSHFVEECVVSRTFGSVPDEKTIEKSHLVQECVASRPIGIDPGEQFIGKSHIANEYAVSRPVVTYPDEKIIEQCQNVEECVASRPFGIDPEEEIKEQCDNVGECVVCRPIVAYTDDETIGTPMEEDNEYSSHLVPKVVDLSILSPAKLGVPIAQLTGDSDDDSVGSELVEDDGLLAAVWIPGTGISSGIDVAPRVKVLQIEEGEEDESQFDLNSEVVHDPIFIGVGNEVLGSDEEDGMMLKDSLKESNRGEIMEDKYSDVTEEVKNQSFVASNEHILSGNCELDGNKDLEQEIESKERSVLERKKANMNTGVALQSDSMVQKHTVIENEEENGAVKSCLVTGTKIAEVHSEIMYPVEPKPIEAEMVLAFTSEPDISVNETQEMNLMGSEVNLVQDIDSQKVPTVNFSETCIFEEKKSFENGHPPEPIKVGVMEDGLQGNSISPGSGVDSEARAKTTDEAGVNRDKLEDVEEDSSSDDGTEDTFGVSDTANQVTTELGQQLDSPSLSDKESARDQTQTIDGQIGVDSDEEVETYGESEGKAIVDSGALAALLRAATSTRFEGGSVTISSADGSRIFSLEHLAGSNPHNLFKPLELTSSVESEEILNQEEKNRLHMIQQIIVKFLRLVHRIGGSIEDSTVAQVLYHLVVAAGRPSSQATSLEAAKREAMELEAGKQNDLEFSLNILVIGKTGVGKSATINSLFGEEKSLIDAFEPATIAVKEIIGKIDGIKVRVLDTPGLRSSLTDQSFNRKVLSSIKNFTKKCSPDIVLYVDRVDLQSRDLNDLPLLNSITISLGSSIWRNAIVALTHAASTPPDGPSGSPLSYDVFVAQRSRAVRQLISHVVGDLQMNSGLPVSLVENHPLCKMNGDGQLLLPSGESWRTQLLLLCFSMKILFEANSVVKPYDLLDYKKPVGFRVRSPPLPHFLSSLLQSYAHPKLSNPLGENVDSDLELEHLSDSEQEDEDEHNQLPPFKPLRKSQIAQLTKEQKKAYFDEYDYRVKLLQKKQWRDEVKRFREMKKKGKDLVNYDGDVEEDGDAESGSPAAVAVPLPDMTLPPSFDGENPTYRYRFLEPTSQFLARPVMDSHGWDHDYGYNGVSLEEYLAISGLFPAVISVQITKEKNEFNVHLDSSVSAKHGENGSTMAGLNIQTVGKQLAYNLKTETIVKFFKRNRTAAGVSITLLGENVAKGLKFEDQITVGKQLVLVGSTGAIGCQGEAAYGANLEVSIREKDFPIGQDQTTLGLSLMKWRGDSVWGCNLQSQFTVGRSSKMAVRVGLDKRLSGQISIRTSSSDQLQIGLLGLLPIASTIFRNLFPQLGEKR